MLDKFRQAKSVLGYFFFGIIIVVFAISFGPGSIGSGAPQGPNTGAAYAASVNGQIISEGEFQQAYANLYRYMRSQAGEGYDAARARQDDLKGMALSQLVDQELLAQTALSHGVRVSDEELRGVILSDTSFQVNGQFDTAGYQRYLQFQLGISPAKYEERMRRRMLAGKMRDLLLGSTLVSDDEARAEFLADAEKAKVGFVTFSPAMFKDAAAPTAPELAKFLDANSEKVLAQYEQSKYLYGEPASAQARRILIQVMPGGDEAAAKIKADQAYAELAAGTDFALVAKKYSDDSLSKDKGGEVGWVAAGKSAFGRTFEEETAKLQKGQLSAVFKDRLGFQIVRVDDTRPPSQKSFDEVKSDVAKQLLADDKARELARKKAGEALARAKSAADLKKAFPAALEKEGMPEGMQMAPRKPEYRETDEFGPSDSSLTGLGYAPAIAKLAFSLGLDKPVAALPVEEHGAFFAVVLLERARAEPEKFEAEKQKWKEQAQRRKQMELYQKLVESLRAKANIDQNKGVLAYSDDPQAAAQ